MKTSIGFDFLSILVTQNINPLWQMVCGHNALVVNKYIFQSVCLWGSDAVHLWFRPLFIELSYPSLSNLIFFISLPTSTVMYSPLRDPYTSVSHYLHASLPIFCDCPPIFPTAQSYGLIFPDTPTGHTRYLAWVFWTPDTMKTKDRYFVMYEARALNFRK